MWKNTTIEGKGENGAVIHTPGCSKQHSTLMLPTTADKRAAAVM
jgi:hypothetical protein